MENPLNRQLAVRGATAYNCSNCSWVLLICALLAWPAFAQSATQYQLRPSAQPQIWSLSEVFQRAKINSKEVQTATHQLEQAQARVGRAYSSYLPQLSLSGTFTVNFPEIKTSTGSAVQNAAQAQLYDSVAQLFNDTQSLRSTPAQVEGALGQITQLSQSAQALRSAKTSSVVIQPKWVFDAKLMLSQPLLRLSGIAAIRNSRLEVERSQINVRAVQAKAVLAAGEAYLSVARALRLEKVARSQLARANQQLARIENNLKHGLARAIDRRRLLVEVNEASDQLNKAIAGSSQALGSLGVLLQQEEEFRVDISPDLESWQNFHDADQIIDDALARRDDMRRAAVGLQIAEQLHIGAYAQLFPTVDLVAQGLYSSNTSGFINKPVRGAILLSVSLPLFDGGDTFAKIRESDGKIREEQVLLRELRMRVAAEVRAQLDEIKVKKISLALALDTHKLRRLIFHDSEIMHQQGLSDTFDLIQNNHLLYQSEIGVENARADLQLAYIELASITGGLLDAI